MIKFNVASFTDSTGTHGAARDAVAAALGSVGTVLSNLLSSSSNATPIDLDVRVLSASGQVWASAGATELSPNPFNFNGLNVLRNVVSEKIITGVDINAGAADGQLNIYSSFLDSPKVDWANSSSSHAIVGVLLHEMTHALGFASGRDRSTGEVRKVSGANYQFETVFDTFINLQGGTPVFSGSTVQKIFGGALPLAPLGTISSISHISGDVNTGSGVGHEVMAPSTDLSDGSAGSLSDTDLAVLRDLGYSPTKTLVSRDGHGFFVGAGTQIVNGSSGVDTAFFSNTRSSFTVSASAGTLRVASSTTTADVASLSSIERLQFTDKKLAFDANAITTAKILGAVFGKSSVANTGYVGIGLGLLDGGTNYVELMKIALNARLGAASNEDVVKLLYTDLVGSAPSASELNYYSGLISSGHFTQAQLGVFAADTSLNSTNINLVGLAAVGLEYS